MRETIEQSCASARLKPPEVIKPDGELPVACTLRAKFPDLRLIICADDDASAPSNPGLDGAAQCRI